MSATSETQQHVQGVVVEVDDLVATLEVGDEREEWIFPLSLLPADVTVDSVLTFDGSGSAARVIDHRIPATSVEQRLGRALNRRRLHLD
ncbi:MAG: hypothetical protein ACXWCB_17875 [Acidimicrobiales bacterium]